MEVIVIQTEMGNVCIKFQNVEDYHSRKERACRNPGGCLMCKALDDSQKSQTIAINTETTIGMT
eukprot:15130299-Heterocapsa_arctica.AAC.1